jgi:hypothetical protein
MSRVQSGWERHSSLETNNQLALNRAHILLAAEREVFVGGVAPNNKRPVHSFDESFEFIWTLAGRVHASYQSTHAISGDIVNGNMVLLKPPEDSNVGQSKRTTPFERNANRQPLGSLWSALGNSHERRRDYSEESKPDP